MQNNSGLAHCSATTGLNMTALQGPLN